MVYKELLCAKSLFTDAGCHLIFSNKSPTKFFQCSEPPLNEVCASWGNIWRETKSGCLVRAQMTYFKATRWYELKTSNDVLQMRKNGNLWQMSKKKNPNNTEVLYWLESPLCSMEFTSNNKYKIAVLVFLYSNPQGKKKIYGYFWHFASLLNAKRNPFPIWKQTWVIPG